VAQKNPEKSKRAGGKGKRAKNASVPNVLAPTPRAGGPDFDKGGGVAERKELKSPYRCPSE